MGLALGGAQAQPPALQDVDSRGFEPWIDRALDRTHAHDLDWAAHLLLFCAEPKRWLDAVRAERDWGERRPKVRERIVSLNERAARLCQTVREDQLARLPDLAARLAERGHPPQALRALPLSPAQRPAARERAAVQPLRRDAPWRAAEQGYWLLWTLRLCAPREAWADPEGWAAWEQLEAERQTRELPPVGAPAAHPYPRRALPPPFDDFRRVGDRLAGWEAQLLQHCPASRDAGR